MTRNTKGGSAVLKARVHASAIISKIQRGDDHYREREFIVDQRGLKAVRVLQAYPQVGVSAPPTKRD